MTAIIGSLAWAELTGGKLTFAEKLSLVRTVLKPITLGMARTWLKLDDTRALDYNEIVVPDTALVKSAIEALEDCASDALVQHSWRTYMWGAAFGTLGEIAHDPELLLVGSLLHDLGATPKFHGTHPHQGGQPCHCFTLDSAYAAMHWAESHGMPEVRRRQLGEMITLHMNGHVTLDDGAEALLLQQGAACDVIGARYHEIDPRYASRVLAEHPRNGFNREFIAFLKQEAAFRPHSRTALLMDSGLSLLIRANPFDE